MVKFGENSAKFWQNLRNFGKKTAKDSAIFNENFLAKIGFDTAENEPLKVRITDHTFDHIPSVLYSDRASPPLCPSSMPVGSAFLSFSYLLSLGTCGPPRAHSFHAAARTGLRQRFTITFTFTFTCPALPSTS